MKKVVYSLRLRLLLMTVFVLTMTLGAVAFFSSREAAVLLRRYAVSDAASGLEPARDVLNQYYAAHGNWDGVEPVLEQTGKFRALNFVLFDARGQRIATSGGKLADRNLSAANITVSPDRLVTLIWEEEDSLTSAERQNGKTTGTTRLQNTKVTTTIDDALFADLTTAGNTPTGTLCLLPSSPLAERNQVTFINSLNGSLIFATLFAVCAAIGVTFALSRRILGPIEELTAAVQKLAVGDFSRRVEITSKDEIGELARAFNRMADSLVRTEMLRRNLVNDVAHELRAPLTHIRCQLETMQDGLLETNPAAIDALHAEAMQLSRIVDDLQELALAESNQLRLNRQPLPVRAEIDAVVSALQSQAAGKGITLTAEIPADLPPLDADAQRFGQIMRNLLNNALTHTSAGGTIKISARALASLIEITVADSGAGIAAAHLDKIFERFYRADESRERHTGGVGLGLPIVKQLIASHGGEIRVESVLNGGTTFILRLPADRSNTSKTS